MTQEYFYGSHADCREAVAIIDINSGWPSEGTLTWLDEPIQTNDPDVYAVPVPTIPFGKDIAMMIQGVSLPKSSELQFPDISESV